jgi:hypothetical protein
MAEVGLIQLGSSLFDSNQEFNFLEEQFKQVDKKSLRVERPLKRFFKQVRIFSSKMEAFLILSFFWQKNKK